MRSLVEHPVGLQLKQDEDGRHKEAGIEVGVRSQGVRLDSWPGDQGDLGDQEGQGGHDSPAAAVEGQSPLG